MSVYSFRRFLMSISILISLYGFLLVGTAQAQDMENILELQREEVNIRTFANQPFQVLGTGRTVITFEGLSNGSPIGTVSGVKFGSAWFTLVDSDAGGSGNTANEPSPETAAYIPDGQYSRKDTRITFLHPVNQVSFYYSLNTDYGNLKVYFYNSGGSLLGTRNMNKCTTIYCGISCEGDPDGGYCSWIKLSFNAKNIAYMQFYPADDTKWIIDNLVFASTLDMTPTGFYYPIGRSGFDSKCGTWLSRDKANGGCYFKGYS